MKRWRVLLVDADPVERERALDAAVEFAPDLDMHTVDSVAGSLLLLGAGRVPDLALIDRGFGRDACQELIEALRLLPGRPVPSVVVSADDDDDAHEDSLVSGADDFWVKPLEYDDFPRLFTLVRFHLGRLAGGL